MITFFVTAACIGVALYLYRKNKEKSEPEVAQTSGNPFPCKITGSIGASPMEDRVKALAIEAASKGITITGDYAKDVAAQGGEMTLLGYGFNFNFDSNGQVQAGSTANLFGVDYPVEGGMTPDGTLGMDIVVGGARVQVQGQVKNGVLTNGKVVKGWLPHIYGVMTDVKYTKI